jgi:hypothetical protein
MLNGGLTVGRKHNGPQQQLGPRSSSDLRASQMEVSNSMMRMLRIENRDGRHHAVEEYHNREWKELKFFCMSFVLCEVVTSTFLSMQHGIWDQQQEA